MLSEIICRHHSTNENYHFSSCDSDAQELMQEVFGEIRESQANCAVESKDEKTCKPIPTEKN